MISLAVFSATAVSSASTSSGLATMGRNTITGGPRTLWANVKEMQTAHLTGTGFSPTPALSCRVVDAPYDGTNFCPFCQSPAEVPRPTTFVSATELRCPFAGSASPGGFASGSGNLQLSASNKTWPRGGWPLDFEPCAAKQ